MGLASLLPVLGVALLLRRVLDSSYAAGLLHAVAAIVLVLFVGGLAGMLWWTALAIHLVGVGVLGNELRVRSRGGFPTTFRIPMPIVVLVACTIVFALVHGNDRYVFYDEFSHWGVFIREMLALDGFWTADTNSLHPRYPPAAPLWQYFFNVFRQPSEGMAYIAQFVLLLTPLLVLFEKIEWQRAYWVPLVLALCVLAVADFGLGISSLYVDHLIAVWFAGIILCFVLDTPEPKRLLIYAVPLVTLAMLKESSLAFALAAAGVLGALAWYRSWQVTLRPVRAAASSAGSMVVLVMPALVCLALWNWHLNAIGAPADLQAVGGIVSGFAESSTALEPGTGPEITRRFLEVFNEQQLANDGVSRQFNAFSYGIKDLFTEPFRLTTMGVFITYLIWWAALLTFVLRGVERRIWAIVAGGIAFTAAAYIGALYLSYRFASGEYGLELSSYTRYVNTIVLPMLIVSLAPLLPAYRPPGREVGWKIAGRELKLRAMLATAACIGLYVVETPYLRPLYEPNPEIGLRMQLEPITESLANMAGRSRVWVYLPNDMPNLFVGELLQYLLAPAPAYVERDDRFFERAPNQVFSAWTDFGYVWLPSELPPEQGERFTEVTGFSPDERIFSVVTNPAGPTGLAPLGSTD